MLTFPGGVRTEMYRGLLQHLKSQVVSLQTADSWANAGVLLGDACIGSGVVFEAIKLLG